MIAYRIIMGGGIASPLKAQAKDKGDTTHLRQTHTKQCYSIMSTSMPPHCNHPHPKPTLRTWKHSTIHLTVYGKGHSKRTGHSSTAGGRRVNIFAGIDPVGLNYNDLNINKPPTVSKPTNLHLIIRSLKDVLWIQRIILPMS